jgi:peptidoglycan/LPS O-acetylase OafA/YrhL
MFLNIYLLRIVAILLIINQHLTSLYPIRSLSFGGHLGNSLFFMISGLGLTLSFQHRPLALGAWLRKRFLKLVIPVTLFTFFTNIGQVDGFFSQWYFYLIPHSATQLDQFLPNLIVLYLLFYFINKQRNSVLFLIFLLILISAWLTYFLQYPDPSTIRSDLISVGLLYPFSAAASFVLGMLIGRFMDVIDIKLATITRSVLAAVAFVIVMGLEVAIKKYFPASIFLCYYLNIATVLLLFLASTLFNNIPSLLKFSDFISGVAVSSLAVYIIHFQVIYTFEKISPPSFAAVAYVFCISFSLAHVANLASTVLVKQLRL